MSSQFKRQDTEPLVYLMNVFGANEFTDLLTNIDCGRIYSHYMNRSNLDKVVNKYSKYREGILKKTGFEEIKCTESYYY